MKRIILSTMLVLVLSFAILPANSAEAATVTWSGTLVDQPDILDADLSACVSGTRLQESYDLVPFYVDTSGNYDILITAAAGMPFTSDDTLIALYQGSFAGDWATNCIGVNDDNAGWLSGFVAMPLTADTQYILLVTYAWQSSGDGVGATYDAQIDGAGEICLGSLGACDPPAPLPPALSVPNLGLVQINAWQATHAYGMPGMDQILVLPADADGNGFDTYVVADVALYEGEYWLGLFIGGGDWVWVRYDAVQPLTEIAGID